jgi:ribosomal protein S18 acetylase RimI-like enzyme
MTLNLRTATEDDRAFLYELHRVTMRDVIDQTWVWDEQWQRADFDRRFAEYAVSIIQLDGQRVGGLCQERKPDSVYIHEIQVLPEYQRRGIGTAVVKEVIELSASCKLPVTLSVVPANERAKRLYERLGFEVTSVEPPFIRMRLDARISAP